MFQNINDSLNETGVLRTSEVIKKYHCNEELYDGIASSIPIADSDVDTRTREIVNALRTCSAKRLMLLGPENKLIEVLIEEELFEEIIVCFRSDCSEEVEQEVFSRVPKVPRGKNVSVSCIRDNKVPLNFSSDNGVILACGFGDDSRALVMDTVYSMIDKYKSFPGRRVLATLGNVMIDMRPYGWIPINTSSFFNVII